MNRLPMLLLAALIPLSAWGQSPDAESPKLDSAVLSGLKFRGIGPALMSGRIADLAIDWKEPNTWYVAVGSGNLWKTVNAGTTWQPVFDNYASYSMGCVTIDPDDHQTIWVGSGEAVGGRHVGYGDGVYVSRDGGATFQNVGLKDSEHIAKIMIDPRDSQVVYVASQGPLWSSGGERGLYKTTDGGKNWQLVLAKGKWTGVTDVAMDPRNPDVLYAATHQRQRTVAALLNAGPESGIYKSTDAGTTWAELTNGLPGGDKGKIAIAVSPQQPDVVYATMELAGREGGFYRSENGGASWSKMSDFLSGGTGPHYYQEIWVDPHRFDVIYHADVVLARSEDGGKTWQGIGNEWKHVDNHAVAFHPTDADFLLVGCDGGLYKSYDRGASYAFTANLPLTQFYKLDVDYDWPVYHVVGGTQDNNTQYGPARNLTANGIRNADWRITIGGDGHDCAIDPKDPNIIYCESQQGFLRRFDRRTGQSVDIRPQPGAGEDDLRFNWDSPIYISPHLHTRLYFGSKKLFRSDDRGDSWTAVSGDLSRGLDRLKLKMMDRIWSIDAAWDLMAMSQFGNITSITESPLVEGLVYVGTDDGLIQVTEDGGQTWRRIEKIYGIPEFAFVNDIKADLFDADTVYAVLDNHKEGDFRPMIIKSTDRGNSWSSLVGDLPPRHLVWRIIQDHEKPELLFAATEFGIFCTFNGGENWIKLTSGLPTIPFRDLEIQRRENDLVGASFGRSFYVLDDYSPLRQINESLLKEQPFVLFPVKQALLYVADDLLGGLKGSQGDAYYTAENAPLGATFTYYLRDALQTQKQLRQKQEAERKKSGGDNPYPGWDVIKQEDRETPPVLFFEITDAAGNVVDRIDGQTSAGVHREVWNLRYAPFTSGGGRRFFGGGGGPLVVPGTYTVQAYQRAGDQTVQLGSAQQFNVQSVVEAGLAGSSPEQTLEFQMQAGQLQRAVSATQSALAEALQQMGQVIELIRQGRELGVEILDETRQMELRLIDAQEAIGGDPTRERRSEPGAPSVASRVSAALFGTLNNTYGPTQTQRQQLEIAQSQYDAVSGDIRQLLEVDLPALYKKLDEAGLPWTPGRGIPPDKR